MFMRTSRTLLIATAFASLRLACCDPAQPAQHSDLLRPATSATGQGWDAMWKEDLREPDSPVPLQVQGSIPSWVDGSLIRNAPAQYATTKNSVTFAFDGLAKLFKFNLHEGKVQFQERFLRTALFNKTRADQKFPKTAMMGNVEPPWGMFDLPKPSLSDNTNIQVFPMAGAASAIATTDSAVYTLFDVDSLGTTGKITPPKQGLSASHMHYLPGSAETVMVNFATNLIAVKEHEITVFKMGADYKQVFFGKTSLDYIPYIHSFGVTPTHMLLFAYPLGFAEMCTLEFKPLIECATWYDRNTTLFVFDLNGNPDSAPVMTVEMLPHFTMHHVNAYEDEEAFWVEGNTYFSSNILTAKYVHADLRVMHNQTERNQVPAWSEYTRLRIDRKTGSSNMEKIELRDNDGYVYNMDFPYVNPSKDGQKHCVVWGLTAYAENSTDYSDWAILRTDVCSGAVNNTIAWYEPNQYPSEPVFVPKPGGAEDDGVLLSQVVDGTNSTTYLLVLDPKTMKKLAHAYLPSGWATPYTQHGRWFDAKADMNVIV